jgi:hypothetical protein
MFQDISHFSKGSDYVPIFTAAIITDAIVMIRLISGSFQSKTLSEWYHKYSVAGVAADVLSIVIGVIVARAIYPLVFSSFSIFKLVALAVVVQVIHDITFYLLFQSIPRGRSSILDTFKDYAGEMGITILFADAAMMVSTVVIASLLAGFRPSVNLFWLVLSSYIIIYLLYSIQ